VEEDSCGRCEEVREEIGVIRDAYNFACRLNEMVDRGELTPAQARRHPRRNIITRAVGSEAFVTSDLTEVPVREGDVFLLCSDGLTNAVEEAELQVNPLLPTSRRTTTRLR
jgi:serine/threonine protein phosphatase PrpC